MTTSASPPMSTASGGMSAATEGACAAAEAMSAAAEGMSAATGGACAAAEGMSAPTEGASAAESPSGVTVTYPTTESPAPGKALPASIVAASAKARSAVEAAPTVAKAPRPSANKDPA